MNELLEASTVFEALHGAERALQKLHLSLKKYVHGRTNGHQKAYATPQEADDTIAEIRKSVSLDKDPVFIFPTKPKKRTKRLGARKHPRLYDLAIGESVFVADKGGKRIGGGTITNIQSQLGFRLTRRKCTVRGKVGTKVTRVA